MPRMSFKSKLKIRVQPLGST